MATRADLAARIASDLDRSDITGQIDAAISDAVTYYESHRFAFNEVSNRSVTFSSSVAVVALSSLSVYFTKIDRLRMNYAGSTNLTDLIPRDYDWIMSGQDAQAVCRPLEYCVYAQSIQFDSKPDANYTGIIDGVRRLASATSTASDSGAWYNEGKQLIRARAKVELYTHIIKEFPDAQIMALIEQREYSALKQKLNTHNSGRVRPTEW